jgi:hypothetical protein
MLLDMRLEQAILRRRTGAPEYHGVASFAQQFFAKLAECRVSVATIRRIKAHHCIKKWSLWPIARGGWNDVERVVPSTQTDGSALVRWT